MKQRIPVVLLNDTRVDNHFGCELVCSAIENLLDEVGAELIASAPAHADWRKNESVQRAFKRARLVLINGEGTIHHDSSAGRVLLEAAKEAQSHGIPCGLINTGWEDNGSVLQNMLCDVTLISARDTISAEGMSCKGVVPRIVPDLSIFETLRRLGHRSTTLMSNRSGVGFTDSVDRTQTIRIANTLAERSARVINIFTAQDGYHHFIRAGISLRRDWTVPRRLLRLFRMRHLLWRERVQDANEFIRGISSLELLVSGRFHACTVSLATETPVVGLKSNTSKIASLFEDAGLDCRRSLDPSDSLPETAIDWQWTAQERQNLGDYLSHAAQSARLLFTELARIAA